MPRSEPRKSATPHSRQLTLTVAVNIGIALSVVLALFFASTLSTTPSVVVKENSYNYRDKKSYSNFVENYMKNSLTSQSKLLFRSNGLEEAMRQEFPEIDQISAVVPLGGRKLAVNMAYSEPLAVLQSGSEKGIVTSKGVLATKASATPDVAAAQVEQLPLLRFSTPQEDFSTGSSLLTSSEVELLELISTELKDTSLTISEFLFNISDGQLELRFSDQPYFVKFSVYADVRVQVGSMLKAIQQLESEGQQAASYIDVRVPGRVYIK